MKPLPLRQRVREADDASSRKGDAPQETRRKGHAYNSGDLESISREPEGDAWSDAWG
ncbi:hypothetical protein L226DRAFT_541014 [Lentinus tigrinus ALCF2SS1-7]|uniref:uncharacterized protein n=1 Tax=Lentinus tigrinus ALCF2SS1-7 TaxID=1328758 RepID=UPI001165D72C|nr:hypothetical protein L226DRAFT_541014 [Lentinus tigrinus ALCF2SS1-7]